MQYEITDKEKKIVKITCTIKEYLNSELSEYIKIAERMGASKIIIEMDNTQ